APVEPLSRPTGAYAALRRGATSARPARSRAHLASGRDGCDPIARGVGAKAEVLTSCDETVVEQVVAGRSPVDVSTQEGVGERVVIEDVPSRLTRETKAEAGHRIE